MNTKKNGYHLKNVSLSRPFWKKIDPNLSLVLVTGTDTLDIDIEYNFKGVTGTLNLHIGTREYDTRSGFVPFTINDMENDSCVTKYILSAHSYLILGTE